MRLSLPNEATDEREATDEPVRRRHVFFIPGFDRKSERYYHTLYRNQARRQAAAAPDLRIRVGKERSPTGLHGSSWTLHADSAAGTVDTCFEVLQWDDIVSAHWATSPGRVLLDGIRTVLFGLKDGAVQRMYRLFRPPVYAVFFPLVVLALSTLLAALVGLGLARVATAWALPPPAAAVIGTGSALLLAWGALRLVHRIQITWLLRLVRFTHLQSTGRVPGIDARLAAFAERIGDVAANAEHDEVLVIGHSVGATLAVQVLARALERDPALGLPRPGPGGRPACFALLSLGHCIPLLSALSPAAALRQDLQRVALSPIDWLDISAPIDWAAFPAVDPVTGAGLPAAPSGWHPLLLSPRFHQLFGPEAYARLKRNRFQVHLQYLMAAERPGPYDYFAITAGPQTLRARFSAAAGDP